MTSSHTVRGVSGHEPPFTAPERAQPSKSRHAASPRNDDAAAPDRDAQPRNLSERFHAVSCAVAQSMGTPWAFFAALLVIVVWAVLGPAFDLNDTWQLVINTGTTIITFLMVFLIQSTQNRDSRALHLKLDELIRASEARNVFADLEDASQEELDAFQREFRELHRNGVRGMDAAVEAGKSHRTRRRHRRSRPSQA